MKKVLIITRYSGTRVPGLIKYLPEFGWQPVLLTTAVPSNNPLPPGISAIETPYRDAFGFWKKLLKLEVDLEHPSQPQKSSGATLGESIKNWILVRGAEVINYPDSYKGWKAFAVGAGDELLQKEKISAIISSSSPVISHLIARELKKKYLVPWIADLRDLWSQNHNYRYSPLRKMFDRRLERKTLSLADALVTVSLPTREKLGGLYKGKAIYAITNGFDPDKAGTIKAGLTAKFTITYTGNIYGGKQDPVKLLVALRKLIEEDAINPDDIEVRFYGSELDWLEKEIDKYGLSGTVKQYGIVPQQVAIEKQKESQLLWLLDWDDPAETGIYPLKIFEYLGSRRPVLATGGVKGNVIGRLLEETKAGVRAMTADSIMNSLREFYGEYKLKGKIPYHGLEAEIGKYTHREMTGKFAAILDHLTKK